MCSACCRLLSSALISTVSAPVSQKRQAKPINFDHRIFGFSNSHWRPHFSYGFDITSVVCCLLLNVLYTYIYIYCCWTGYPHTYCKTPAGIRFFQKYLLFAWKVVSRQKVPLCSTCGRVRSGALFSNESAPAFHLRLQNPMNSEHRFFNFSKSYWEPHFSYGFGMTSSCYNTCDLTKFRKLHDIQFCLIFPLYFNSFMLA